MGISQKVTEQNSQLAGEEVFFFELKCIQLLVWTALLPEYMHKTCFLFLHVVDVDFMKLISCNSIILSIVWLGKTI